jgi:hypothetical protein
LQQFARFKLWAHVRDGRPAGAVVLEHVELGGAQHYSASNLNPHLWDWTHGAPQNNLKILH